MVKCIALMESAVKGLTVVKNTDVHPAYVTSGLQRCKNGSAGQAYQTTA